MPIRVLDQKTASRIAAGEVIERPASVVKELLENALDAGATQIAIEARGGGTGFIRVIDNGGGIPSDQVELAFRRHATSKLSAIEDLDRLETLGFRGEALPSISAVAEVDLVTSTGTGTGDLVQLRDGAIQAHTALARPRGTTVTVRNLFRAVPARLKFLKAALTENAHIAAVTQQYALARPEARITLLLEGRTALQAPGTGRLLDAVIAVYGVEAARQMLPLGEEAAGRAPGNGEVHVTGMVGSPLISRSGRDGLVFFVNRRAISSRLLVYAVEESYQGLLMQGRRPMAVLDINLPPATIDVNVHPAKSEVKFQDERAVFAAVQKAVRAALVTTAPIPMIEEAIKDYRAARSPAPLPSWLFPETAPTAMPATSEGSRLPPLRVLGQVAATYIVAEGPDGVYIIDQHAAHERIVYELVRSQRSERKLEVQALLQPASLELTPAQDAMMRDSLADLSLYGFGIEAFGERSYLVRTIPGVLRNGDWLTAVREFLDDPAKRDKDRSEAIIKTLACHGAVRAGKMLADAEMTSLVRQLEAAAGPFTCPHGRPTLIHISHRQMEKEFGRS